MAKFQVGSGLDEYLAQLENLEFRADSMVGLAIFEGAKIVADQIKANLRAMPTSPPKRVQDGTRRNPWKAEKDGMIAGLGISQKKTTGGYTHVKIGMHGYNALERPNVVVMRTFEAGNSFCNRLAPIAKAVRASKAAAEAAMQAKIEEEIKKTVKE